MIDHASIAMARGAPIAAERIAGRNDNMTTSHFHPFYEIYFLESGSRTYIINEKEYEVKPQTLVLLPPYTMHYSFSAEGQAFCRVVIYFEPQTLPQELRQPLTDTPGLYGFAEALPRQSVAQLIATLVNEEEQDSPYRLICQQATLTALTVQVLRSGLPQPNVPHDDKITRVMRHLSDHYMKNISLDLLAQQFYISKYHLCREFRRYTNSTIIEYSLVTAGTLKLPGYILAAFFLGETIDIVVHDYPLAKRFMSSQIESVVDLGKTNEKNDRSVA